MLTQSAPNTASNLKPGAKASVTHRVVAKLIDIAVVIACASVLPYPLGPLLGFAYSVLGDGLNIFGFQGQSLGKKIVGLQVRSLRTGESSSFRDSVIRNAPVGVATFFAIIPIWGWAILLLVGAPLMVIEVYLMLSIETGHRLGDVMADTEVVPVRPASERSEPSL